MKITPLMRRIMAVLDPVEGDGDMTAADIAEQLDLAVSYIRKHGTQPLHDAGLIRVCSWLPGVIGNPTKVWSLTKGKDAKRPARTAKRVICRRYRAKQASGSIKANNALSMLVSITGRRA